MYDLTTQDKLFNEYLYKGVTAEIKARSKMFDQIRKSWKNTDVSGRYSRQKLMMAASQSTRASSNSSYPTGAESEPGEAIVYIKRMQMFQLHWDGLALESAKAGGTPIDPIEFERKGIFITMSDDISRQMFLDGSGHKCQANGAGSSTTTLVVDSPYFAKATKFLKKNRVIDAYDGVTQKINSIKISSVDSNTQVTLASAQTWTDDSWILNEDVYTGSEGAGLGEIMGLDGIIRNTDPPAPNASAGLQGLLVASYPEWKAYLVDPGADTQLEEDQFIQDLDEIEADIDVILVSQGVRRAWFNILSSYKTLPDQKVMWGGWSGLPFVYDGRVIPVVADKFVPDGYAYYVSNSNLTLHVLNKKLLTWEKGDAGNYLQKVANKNEYVAEGHIFGNLATGYRKGFGVRKHIKTP